MRNRFVEVTSDLIEKNERLVCLLGEVSIWGFRHSMEKHPDRLLNIGILEQSSISFAAGLSITGLIPVFHTFAPFLVERAYEQLKIDFGYQNLGGNFVSMGSSFDYSTLGSTHHSPADVGVLKLIPNMQIVVPGTANEFENIYRSEYNNCSPTYFRLSEQQNIESNKVEFGKAVVCKEGKLATVIAVGPMLDSVLQATENLDVTVLYYTTVAPFDSITFLNYHTNNNKILLCEPYYSGALAYDIIEALKGEPVTLDFVGIPHKFITCYGSYQENVKYLELTVDDIRKKINAIIS